MHKSLMSADEEEKVREKRQADEQNDRLQETKRQRLIQLTLTTFAKRQNMWQHDDKQAMEITRQIGKLI